MVVSGVPADGLEFEIVVTLSPSDGTAGRVHSSNTLYHPNTLLSSLTVQNTDFTVADPLTVTFPTTSVSGDTVCADITILDDDVVGDDISFSVHLISITPSGVTFGGHLYITVTIQDDDSKCLSYTRSTS